MAAASSEPAVLIDAPRRRRTHTPTHTPTPTIYYYLWCVIRLIAAVYIYKNGLLSVVRVAE